MGIHGVRVAPGCYMTAVDDDTSSVAECLPSVAEDAGVYLRGLTSDLARPQKAVEAP